MLGEVLLRDIAFASLGVTSLPRHISWEISVVLPMVYDHGGAWKISQIELRTRG